MELREKIAREIDAASDDPEGHWASWAKAADAILAIPEIAEALEIRAEKMALSEQWQEFKKALRNA